ncbi:MAG: hypothetical protein AAGB31_06380, partial [Bdellovibrio sp.]
MSTYLELEIQNLLAELGDVDLVHERLLQSLESSPDSWTRDNLIAFSRFLLQAGRSHQLVRFILDHIEDE